MEDLDDVENDQIKDVDFGAKQLQIVKVDDAKRVIVGAGARILFYPTLLYNVFRNKIQSEFRWWDEVDQFLLLGAVPFPGDVRRLKQLGVGCVITLNEPFETLVSTSLYHAHGIDHLVIPTRDYLFAPSVSDISRAVNFIHKNASCGRTTYVHCKAGRGRSTTIVLCYLVEHNQMTPAGAPEYVRSRRPRVLLAPLQWKGLHQRPPLHVAPAAATPQPKAPEVPTPAVHVMAMGESPLGVRTNYKISSIYGYEKAVVEYSMHRQPASIHSPSVDAVMITKADLEGYHSTFDNNTSDKELVILPRMVSSSPMIARLSCLLSSFKVSGVFGPVSGRLHEAHAC
ncbi:putative dual specificity protein phosphatase DSP8 [Hibiscus syriacus]|uniref:phosphatidylglycerophosphatase n=1 Tax=Hibiscus syriacus TaxID=106335 RepID=A0A6A2YTV8_HIBSY|nr:putative dual specificity protein phosphatase DSP8 [Hibiscus syriacus]